MDKNYLGITDLDCYNTSFNLSNKDKIRFYQISKGSLIESRDWINKAKSRKLITIEQYDNINNELQKLPLQINQLIKFTRLRLKE